jgi:hypothetical protein
MPTLTIPQSIWLSATPDERDQFYISAGFDPNLPVFDAGTSSGTIRHGQIDPVAVPVIPEMVVNQPQSGDDLRDFQPVSFTEQLIGPAGGPVTDEFGAPIAGTSLSIAGRALKLIVGGGGGRLTASIWNSLPRLVQTALTQAGIYAGAMIAFNGDIPFITLPGQGPAEVTPFIGPMPLGPQVDIQVGSPSPLQQVQVVGSWVANGVTFYRLADGKLAVQNKKGRWKVWRPKKPIVLYADGASNLKTMLRADKALNKQAKKIASMLNRRAPKRRSSKKDDTPTIIVQGSGRVIDN